MTVAPPKHELSGDMNELDGKIQSMIARGDNMVRHSNRMIKAYVCQVCEKSGLKTNIRYHSETNHLEGISKPCNICDKTFRSRMSLRIHQSRYHNTSI